MKFLYFGVLTLLCQSCFLFGQFKKDRVAFTEDGVQKNYTIIVPKRFNKTENRVDSSGNEEHYYSYPDGTLLYFVRAADTSVPYQPINYGVNLPKQLYGTLFFKGLDSTDHYWRETRFGPYKLGYYAAKPGEDWKFDSALNYFTLRSVR